jgi:hypothetical protein
MAENEVYLCVEDSSTIKTKNVNKTKMKITWGRKSQ